VIYQEVIESILNNKRGEKEGKKEVYEIMDTVL
jgi:hypothetical protein